MPTIPKYIGFLVKLNIPPSTSVLAVSGFKGFMVVLALRNSQIPAAIIEIDTKSRIAAMISLKGMIKVNSGSKREMPNMITTEISATKGGGILLCN